MTAKEQKNNLVPRPNRLIRLSWRVTSHQESSRTIENEAGKKRRLPSLSHQGINSWSLNQHLFSQFTPNNSLVTVLMIMMTTSPSTNKACLLMINSTSWLCTIFKTDDPNGRHWLTQKLHYTTTTTLSNVRELKTFLDCGFRIPDSLSWNLDFGFRIPWTVFQIPKPRILDFLRFRIPQAKLSRILESRFPHMGRTRIESVSHVLKYSNNHNLHKKIKSSSNLVVVTEASQD